MEEDPNSFDFIACMDSSFVNAIRRTIINGIPSIVIDTVCIKENDSSLCDEMIAHRLGLIPLRKISSDYETGIILEGVGPKKIYSRDIVFGSGVEPVSPDILILHLKKDEKIRLTGVIEEGTEKDQNHSKFSVSCGTSYKKLEENKYKFHCETTGAISAKDAVLEAIRILKTDLINFKKLL